MIREAASSRACSGASAGGPSDGSPQIHTDRSCLGPHSAAAGSAAPADSASLARPVFTQSYFHVKSFDLKVSCPQRTNPAACRGEPGDLLILHGCRAHVA